jgi:hypothetical protein
LLAYFVVVRVVSSIPDLTTAGASLIDSLTAWAAGLPVSNDSALVQDLLAQEHLRVEPGRVGAACRQPLSGYA